MDNPDEIHVDHGPPDKWHPIYDTVSDYFDNEAKPPDTDEPPTHERVEP